MHGRERKAGKPQDWIEKIEVSRFADEEVRIEILGTKGAAFREEWLEYAYKDLSLPSGNIQTWGDVPAFGEVLMVCLEDRNASMYVPASELAMMATLWGMPLPTTAIEDRLFELLNKCSIRKYGAVILGSLLTILITEAEPKVKTLELILQKHIAPVIHAAADKLAAELSGETVEENDDGDDENAESMSKIELLVHYLEAWKATAASVSTASLKAIQIDIWPSLVQLLDFNDLAVRIGVAQCLLTLVDLCDRERLDISEDIQEACKQMTRVIYEPDFDWGRNRKEFEQIAEMIKNEETVVTLDLLTVPAMPSNRVNPNGASFEFRKLNTDKKGHPVCGCADAAVMSYLHAVLGSTFTTFFTYSRGHRDVEIPMNALLRIMDRHPSAESSVLHIADIREYGSSSFATNRNAWDLYRNRHRKVKVSDYM